MCLRAHKESCNRKYRLLSEFRNEYFTMMLSKLEMITECKEQLKSSLNGYRDNFEKQRKLCESS